MRYNKILTIQDISCYGQCSLTVALPILSACGVETVILPSAVLSTHTAGFRNYTVKDLSDEMPKICNHWESENIKFDAVYTGYLGSKNQIDLVLDISNKLKDKNGFLIVDPAMADNGKLYPAFNKEYVDEMKKLVAKSDVTLPNITEACYLTGTEYKEEYDDNYVDELLHKLTTLGAKTIILKGISYKKGYTGVIVYENGVKNYYEHKKIEKSFHGTGDIFASCFCGALSSGKNCYESAVISADYTVECIERTIGDDKHLYGVKFEPILYKLAERIKG